MPGRSLLSFFLLFTSFACAQDYDDRECLFSGKVIQNLGNPAGGKILEEAEGVDADSAEITYKHIIEFDNRDMAFVEQKYCSMYNMSVVYKLRNLNKTDFERALNSIDEIIKRTERDYNLKAPLTAVVDMVMNQKKFSLSSAFDTSLPSQAVSSAEYVEHSISLKPLAELDEYDAEIEFYFGLDGE